MRNSLLAAVLLAICLLNAIGQYAISRSGFDNQIVNAYSVDSTDSLDYTHRAEALARGQVRDALDDAHRSPGYPAFLALFQGFAEPQLAARFAQLALTALLPLLFALTLRALGYGSAVQIAGAIAAACFPFFYYFTPILYAEACSVVLASVLLLALARLRPANLIRQAVIVGVLLALMIYLKPNHLIVAGPVAAYALMALPARRRTFLAVALGTVVLALAPWTIFASASQHAFVPLTTTQGYNVWDGTGHRWPSEDGTLMERVADQYGFFDQAAADEVLANVKAEPTANLADKVYLKAAIETWKTQPREQAIFGVAKMLHSFGFSLRGPEDLLVALCTLGALGAAILLLLMNTARAWAVYLIAAVATSAAQSFVFVANQRFSLVMVDPIAVLVVLLAACAVAPAIARRVHPAWSGVFAPASGAQAG
jgi:hypothetical protein